MNPATGEATLAAALRRNIRKQTLWNKPSSPARQYSTKMSEIDARSAEIYEYSSAADPSTFMKPLPVVVLPPDTYSGKGSRTYLWDNSTSLLNTPYPATSPNLLAAFVRIEAGEVHTTTASATSQAFYVVRGSGSSTASLLAGAADLAPEPKRVNWSSGDLFVLPAVKGGVEHRCNSADSSGESDLSAVLYWISDAPLLSYLGVAPAIARIDPTVFRRSRLMNEVTRIRHEEGSEHRNRMGILLASARTRDTKTLTHTLWALLNVLPAGDAQPPHRHNSVALDLAVAATGGGAVYTLMSPVLDDDGRMVNPVKADWVPGAAFMTPPGWWHSHVNESEEDAWVLPMQDAGLYTRQRTLDIRFAPRKGAVEIEGAKAGDRAKAAHALAMQYVVGPITQAKAGMEINWGVSREGEAEAEVEAEAEAEAEVDMEGEGEGRKASAPAAGGRGCSSAADVASGIEEHKDS